MKRNLCKSTSLRLVRRKAAPEFMSRRFPASSHYGSSSYKTDGKDDDPADLRTEAQLLEKIKTQVEGQLSTRATKAEVEAIIAKMPEGLKDFPIEALRAMADDKTGVMAIVTRQGLEITRLEASLKSKEPELNLRGQIAKWQADNKDAITKIVGGTKAELPALEIRLASPMSVATVNAGGSNFIGRVEVEPGINDFIRIAPTFWDFLKKGRTNASTYVWVNKTNASGAAAFIGPGVAKQGVSFELAAENSVAKKIADSAKATTELLQDIDGMASFIEDELKYKVMIKMNEKLMDNVATSTEPQGIKQYSVAFPLASGIKTDNPNYMDAIRAVVGYLRSGLLRGDITVFVNSIDATNMDLSKAQDSGVYLLPPFSNANGTIIGGARIIEDNNVPVGTIQAGFLRFYRVLIYQDFTIAWGWENDDFTKNLVTAIGEMRIHQFVNSIHTGAFLRDTFENIIARIAA